MERTREARPIELGLEPESGSVGKTELAGGDHALARKRGVRRGAGPETKTGPGYRAGGGKEKKKEWGKEVGRRNLGRIKEKEKGRNGEIGLGQKREGEKEKALHFSKIEPNKFKSNSISRNSNSN